MELSAPVTERDHIRGSIEAPVLIVEYGDYECPHCGRAYWALKRVEEELGDRVGFVFRNFPLSDIHPRADAAADALEAAAAQGGFWAMHDLLYEHQHELEGLDLEKHARVVGLDVARWKRDFWDRRYRHRVTEDIATGRESGVTSTPTFFINGHRHDAGYDFDVLMAAVERHAPAAASTGRSGRAHP